MEHFWSSDSGLIEWSVSLSSVDWVRFSFLGFYCFILKRVDCCLELFCVNPPGTVCLCTFIDEMLCKMPKEGLQVSGMFLLLIELNTSYFEPYVFNLFSSFLCLDSSTMAIDGTLHKFLFMILPSYKIFSNSTLSVIRYLSFKRICYMLLIGFNFLCINASDLIDFNSLFRSLREISVFDCYDYDLITFEIYKFMNCCWVILCFVLSSQSFWINLRS